MSSVTPLQALVTLNAPEFVEAARVLAARLLRDAEHDEARLGQLFSMVLARAPRDSERTTLQGLLDNQRARFKQSPDEAGKLIAAGETPVATELDPIELAAWTAVCRAVLNLHETLTRN